MIFAIVSPYGEILRIIYGDKESAKLNTPNNCEFIPVDADSDVKDKYYDASLSEFIDIPKHNEWQHFNFKDRRIDWSISVDYAKTIACDKLKAERDYETNKPIQYKSNVFDADEKSLRSIQDASKLSENSIPWIDFDNKTVHLTAQELEELAGLIVQRKNRAYADYNEKRIIIMETEDIAKLLK